MSWEAWTFRRGANSEDIVLSWGQTANGLQAGFRDDSYFYFQVAGISVVSEKPYPEINQWHHWAGVYDATAMSMYLYRNGEKVGEIDLPGAAPWRPEGQLRLGSGNGWDPRAGFFGYLDEVRVWTNVARAFSELGGWR